MVGNCTSIQENALLLLLMMMATTFQSAALVVKVDWMEGRGRWGNSLSVLLRFLGGDFYETWAVFYLLRGMALVVVVH